MPLLAGSVCFSLPRMTCDTLEVEEELKSRKIDEDERRRLEKARKIFRKLRDMVDTLK